MKQMQAKMDFNAENLDYLVELLKAEKENSIFALF
jgi:hypothetical protein